MFGVPLIFFVLAAILNPVVLAIPIHQILISFIAAVLFSYLGNLFSMESIKCAPNPGYSLIISKSYVIFIAILAAIIFHSHLSLKNIIAIGLILAFSALITLTKATKSNNLKWIALSIGAFFCWGFLALVFQYQIENGISLVARSFYILLIVNILLFAEIKYKKIKISKSKKHYFLIFAVGVLSGILNIAMQLGYESAPNPGYVNAVNASSISLLTLLASYFFKDELNFKKLFGVMGVTFGLIMLLL